MDDSWGDDVILSCKAGRCTVDGKRVTPQKAKGTLSVIWLRAVDSFLLRWQCREPKHSPEYTDEVDEYLISRNAKITNLRQVKDGAVMLIEEDEGAKILFWIQEPTQEECHAYIAALTDTIVHGLDEEELEGAVQEGGPMVEVDDPPQQQVPIGAISGRRTSPRYQSERETMMVELLHRLLQAASKHKSSPPGREEAITLTDVVAPLLGTFDFDDKAKEELKEHLPPELLESPTGIQEALKSPQLRFVLRHLAQAISQGEGVSLLMAMGVASQADAEDSKPTRNFIDALEKQQSEAKKQE